MEHGLLCHAAEAGCVYLYCRHQSRPNGCGHWRCVGGRVVGAGLAGPNSHLNTRNDISRANILMVKKLKHFAGAALQANFCLVGSRHPRQVVQLILGWINDVQKRLTG